MGQNMRFVRKSNTSKAAGESSTGLLLCPRKNGGRKDILKAFTVGGGTFMHKKRIAQFLLCGTVFLVLWSVVRESGISLEEMLAVVPENLLLTATILLLAYLLKSFIMVLPISVLRIAAGHFLSLPFALLINVLGSVLTLSIPHQIGQRMGKRVLPKLIDRYPKLERLITAQRRNEKFLSYFLRLCYILPADATTVFLGASGIAYSNNLIYGLLGTLPSLLITTILGSSIRNPTNQAFWFSLTLIFLLAVVSAVIYHKYRKKSEEDKA